MRVSAAPRVRYVPFLVVHVPLDVRFCTRNVQDPLPRPRLQRIPQEIGEGIVPPLLAQVLERAGAEQIDVS